jgi:3'(2'), 5'-bisphosphate nucleotidase
MPDSIEVSPASLDRLRDIARKAGDAIMENYTPGAGSVAKSDGSPLTRADTAAERVIVDALGDWDSSVPIISEETKPAPYTERKSWKRFWLVDPLDGTKEFLNHNGEFTVNIALIENGEPVMGVVHAPAMDLMYAAAKGMGAWRSADGAPSVRIYGRARQQGDAVVAVESRSHATPELESYLASLHVEKRIRMGSSLKFCLVADGTADIYPRLGPTMEWDVAAGDCVYRNSGKDGQRESFLSYNKADLRNGSFVLGDPHDDAKLSSQADFARSGRGAA